MTCENNKRLRQLKCITDDLLCLKHSITREDLESLLNNEYTCLELKDVSGVLSTKVRNELGIDLTETQESKTLKRALNLDKDRREYAREKSMPKHKDWANWRASQIERLGDEDRSQRAQQIMHIPFAIELTNGCSGGCKFCGLSAKKLEPIDSDNENNHVLFRACLEALKKITGEAHGSMGILYWATDPMDFSAYSDYASTYAQVFGKLPGTTTALIDTQTERLKEYLSLYSRIPSSPWSLRASLRSKHAYLKAKKELSELDRCRIKFIPQYLEEKMTYANAGRAFEGTSTAEGDQRGSTIACTTGFLIKLPSQSIELITPCRADKYNPNGYRVLGKKEFKNQHDIATAMDSLLEKLNLNKMSEDSYILKNIERSSGRYVTRDGNNVHNYLTSEPQKIGDVLKGLAIEKQRVEALITIMQMIRDGAVVVMNESLTIDQDTSTSVRSPMETDPPGGLRKLKGVK